MNEPLHKTIAPGGPLQGDESPTLWECSRCGVSVPTPKLQQCVMYRLMGCPMVEYDKIQTRAAE